MRDRIATVFSSLLYMVLRRLLGMISSRDRAVEQVPLENLVLRHQVAILRRQVKRPVYSRRDRALLTAASRILPRNRWNTFLVRPETLLRWHKGLVARKWTRPHRRPGRPAIDPEVRRLILLMAKENPRWDYMRIKGELQKLGIRVLRHQLKVLSRQIARPRLRRLDRLLLAAASRALPRGAWQTFLVSPSTLLRWHRELVRRRWTFRRVARGGRPGLQAEVAALVLRLARENPR